MYDEPFSLEIRDQNPRHTTLAVFNRGGLAGELTVLTGDLDERKALALNAILEERAYQDDKWGTIDEHPHTVAGWLLILERELEEAKKGWVEEGGDYGALREIVQVVAVGLACLEQHGAVNRSEA